jgi:acetyl esterase/lipase
VWDRDRRALSGGLADHLRPSGRAAVLRAACTNDSLIPVEQARSFTARLSEVSRNPVVYAELPCAQHAFDVFGSARAAHAAVAVEQFLASMYASDQKRLDQHACGQPRHAIRLNPANTCS